MHRIDTSTAQVDKFGAGKNGFTAGNIQTGTPATDLDNNYFDMLQEELAGVVEATGVALDKSRHNQLLTALKALLLTRENPFADIKSDGAAAIAEALSNLGLGDAAKQGVATNTQMATGTATNLLPSVAAVMSLFNKRAFSANDYIRIPDVPGGLIIQWGTVVSGSFGDTSWTYPTPFPNARLATLGIFHRQGTSGTDYPTISFNNISDPTPKTLSNFMLRANGTGAAGLTAFVLAIGY